MGVEYPVSLQFVGLRNTETGSASWHGQKQPELGQLVVCIRHPTMHEIRHLQAGQL